MVVTQLPIAAGAWRRHLAGAAAMTALRIGRNGLLIWLMLARRDPRTPKRVIAGLWCLPVGPPLVLGAADLALGYPLGAAWRMLGGMAVIGSLISTTIWTTYLVHSDRVAETYTFAGEAGRNAIAAVFD